MIVEAAVSSVTHEILPFRKNEAFSEVWHEERSQGPTATVCELSISRVKVMFSGLVESGSLWRFSLPVVGRK